ncbi:hypothetical protein MUU53_04435 [Rhizobium lemnae]|uniref:AfsA-related hotdog domain-containing protein n=1 Tax=Rhizobium lemnae TaxID=1214924 RepID=A0ABV8EAC9_9HYPH|nr:AfsA-related hotdog domain-containing protein [Rhizobium lemnae]MCJ8507155.1 hypothetical protein [Rhizobium lemnae]
MNQFVPIQPKLLHKSSTDDVLLANPRPAVPAFLSAGRTSDDEISTLYDLNADGDHVMTFPDGANAAGSEFLAQLSVSPNARRRGVPYQILDEHLSHCFAPSDAGQAIAGFLDRYEIRRPSTSLQFVNTADHYFFYKKPHEHVPGIMLLEAARQSIYYQLYTYSKHALGNVTVSLSELQAKFHAYAELMYPIEIVVDDLTEGDDPAPRKVHYLTSFFQRGRLIAEIASWAPVIALDRFQRARNVNLLDQDNFAPLPVAPVVTVVTAADMSQSVVSLLEVGKDGCKTTCPSAFDGSVARIAIIFDRTLCFSAKAVPVEGSDTTMRWTFADVSYNELETLKEIIKRGFVAQKITSCDGRGGLR